MCYFVNLYLHDPQEDTRTEYGTKKVLIKTVLNSKFLMFKLQINSDCEEYLYILHDHRLLGGIRQNNPV